MAFFRRKLGRLVPTRRWDDLETVEHDSAFMVAGAMKADLLSDLAAAVDRAIAEGKSLDAFRKDFRAIVERNGWHGWTGEDSKAGRAWRTRTIYRTNAATSYSAGRHAQLSAGNFAFWVYRHGNAKEPRLEHLAWDGLFLPPDHGFWIWYYPPSGWGCTCYVVGARSERAALRLGGNPDKKLPDGWNQVDPATGAPKGISKGWGYAPGESVSPTVRALAAKIGQWDHQVAKAFMDEVPAAQRDALARSYRALPSMVDDARRYAQRVLEPTGAEIQPSRTLGLAGDLAAKVAQIVGRDVAAYDFAIDASAVRHVHREHGDPRREAGQGQRAVTAADFARLPELLNAPDQIREGETVASAGGVRAVVIEKTIGGEIYRAVFVPRHGRRTLALLTMYVKLEK